MSEDNFGPVTEAAAKRSTENEPEGTDHAWVPADQGHIDTAQPTIWSTDQGIDHGPDHKPVELSVDPQRLPEGAHSAADTTAPDICDTDQGIDRGPDHKPVILSEDPEKFPEWDDAHEVEDTTQPTVIDKNADDEALSIDPQQPPMDQPPPNPPAEIAGVPEVPSIDPNMGEKH